MWRAHPRTNMLVGHSPQAHLLRSLLLKPGPKTILLQGPESIGKFLCAAQIVEEVVHPSDMFVADDAIDGVRQAISFARDAPVFSSHRIIIARDIDKLSDAAQ